MTYLVEAILSVFREPDASLHLTLQDGDTLLSRHFPPTATVFEVMSWAAEPLAFKETTMRPAPVPEYATKIAFDQTTGKLTLYTGAKKPPSFDANDDEALVRLVRRVKALTPVDHGQPSLNIPLPVPTSEQLERAQRYTTVASAHGAGKYTKPRARYNAPSLSAEASLALIQNILAEGLTLTPPSSKPKSPS